MLKKQATQLPRMKFSWQSCLIDQKHRWAAKDSPWQLSCSRLQHTHATVHLFSVGITAHLNFSSQDTSDNYN